MKIAKIKVERLFGLDDNDFDIECFPNEYVTILYAFNGVGKTTLLRLVDAVLSVKMQILDSIAFKKIEICFDNDEIIAVEKLGDYKNPFIKTKCKDLYFSDTDIPVYPIKYSVKIDKKTKEYYLRLSEGFAVGIKKELESTVGEIKEVKGIKLKRKSEAIRKGEEINLSSVNEDDIETCPVNPLLFDYYAYVFFEWNDLWAFQDNIYGILKQKINSNLILANKHFDSKPRGEWDPRFEIFRNYPPSLDDFYLTDEQIKNISYYIRALEKEDKSPEVQGQIIAGIDKTKEICGIIKARLRCERNSDELKVFHKLLNEEFGFMYKTIEFDEQKGLKVVPIYNGDPILDVIKLSSGEKKLIVLFYNLLFESTIPGSKDAQSIILIDEPETSLHIAWQSKLIKNILAISKDRNIQVIIATHSPDVIDDYELLSTEMISQRYKDGKFFNN